MATENPHTRTYHYQYETAVRFVPDVERHFFKLRYVPCQNAFQTLLDHRITTTPDCRIAYDKDGWGNPVQYGSYDTRHELFQVLSAGRVQCSTYRLTEDPHPAYRFATPLTTPTAEMRQWAASLTAGTLSTWAKAECLTQGVYHLMRYCKGITTESTTAADSFRHRQGVCQDYAHLMVAACRACGLAARYVNGLMLGEGETHAWVEVSDGRHWRGFDPTHNRAIDFGYLKIAHGRDVNDCPTNRGQLFGNCAEERICIRAVVTEC